ncbi:unnamed protein product, partial [Acidithrix sp. C25]
VDIKIGFLDSSRELAFEVGDDKDQNEFVETLNALTKSQDALHWIEDKKGRKIGVAPGKIAYIVVGSQQEERRVGFGA